MIIQPKSGSHLYGRGFLGLIPLIGAFVGIGLVLLGVFKYRSKTLVLIGIATMIPTVLIYGSMYFYTISASGKNNLAAFCKPEMDQLVKNIEFYKKEYKVYPDSLKQLEKDQKFLFIVDPIQSATDNKYGINYIYKNEGIRYVLFSMGVDGIPYTEDDIFPSSKYFDSTITGLIRPLR